jgi:predicted RNA binding protein YcfA (HicA-like mRNA interferase family)
MRGSHRVLKHLSKNGIVVVPENLSDEVALDTLRSIWKQAQLEDKS